MINANKVTNGVVRRLGSPVPAADFTADEIEELILPLSKKARLDPVLDASSAPQLVTK